MPRDISRRTGELWEKCKQLAREGKTIKEIQQITGCSRTYAYESIKAVKQETSAEKPLPSKVEIEERVVEPEKLAPSEIPQEEKPEEKPKPLEEVREEEKEEETEEEITPDLEDCKDLYAIPFETMALVFNDDSLLISDERINKQGARLFKIFNKYKFKLPLTELMFIIGLMADLGVKIRVVLKKREEKKKGGENVEKSTSENTRGNIGGVDISSYTARGS